MDQPVMLSEAPSAPPVAGPYWRSKFNIAEILALYDVGKATLRKRHWDRWRETFALGVSFGGLFAGYGGDELRQIAVFYRTDNAVVDLKTRVPEPVEGGPIVYICWQWNLLGVRGMAALRSHIRRTAFGAKFVAGHDNRGKGGKLRRRGDGHLCVHRIPAMSMERLESLLAERNGHAAEEV